MLPAACRLISAIGFSKQMQTDLMICISRSFLSLIASGIWDQDLFLWEAGAIASVKTEAFLTWLPSDCLVGRRALAHSPRVDQQVTEVF